MTRSEPKYKFKQVMLIDDDSLDNFIHQKIIEASFFSEKIFVNTGSKSALEFLSNLEVLGSQSISIFPEVIFVDLNMPIIDGFQFLENFKTTLPEKFNATKLILLTASISTSDKPKAASISKEIKFIHKPLTQQALDQI
jgi:CheY-like chemotaxis protein